MRSVISGRFATEEQVYLDILNRVGKVTVDEMKRLLIKPVTRKSGGRSYPMKKGKLYESIKYNIAKNVVEFIMNDYAFYVDKGRFSGKKKVPIQALVKWIRWNNLQPRNVKGQFQSPIGMAYAIQTNIFKYGITERNFINPAVKMGEALTNELIDIQYSDFIDTKFYNLEFEIVLI